MDKLNQEIHYQLQFVNTKEEKIEEQLKRISQKFCFSEYEAQCLLHASMSADERGKKLLSKIQDTFNQHSSDKIAEFLLKEPVNLN